MTAPAVDTRPTDIDLIPETAAALRLPCRVSDPDLWFAESPADLEQAKALCADCPLRRACLAAALERAEPWGVWGGEILDQGTVIARKRPRGRPRKNPVAA
ncbi:WhiB family transcriptional regulator [Williamsia sp. SKLECPSW1]